MSSFKMLFNILISKVQYKINVQQHERNFVEIQENITAFITHMTDHTQYSIDFDACTDAYIEANKCTDVSIARQKYNEATESIVKKVWGMKRVELEYNL